MPTPSPPDTNPESLFAAWLERVEAGEEADLEELCREHPRHAAGLRALHRRWHQLQDAWKVADDVDPQVTLAPAEPSQADFSSAVLSRLAEQGPASTRYQIKGEVARGGMGAVLRVWDESLRRHLAMKVMLGQGVAAKHGDTPPVDPRMLARFLEEAQITGQLDHPGIVPVHELGLDAEGRVFFSMKLVKGKTLKQVFDEFDRGEGGWTHTRVLGLIQKVCEAMSYAHAKGVIHRDLKPANVMVGKFGEVYVMDWGLARILGHDDGKDIRPQPEQGMLTSEVRSARHERSGETPDMSLMTMDGDVVGTPAYMPPEQAHGDLPAMGPHSDVYAVGAMLYHLLAGHMPYVPRDARPNNYAVWQRVQEGPPRPLHEVAPQAPAELVALCEKAMSREVSRRYPDMSALSADLTAYVEGRVVQAYETGAWAEARKWVRRNRPLAASLAATIVALVAGLGVSLWSRAIAAERLESVLRLSATAELDVLVEEAATLCADELTEYDAWLERAEKLRASLYPSEGDPGHLARLEELHTRALPRTAEDRERDRRTHPRLEELAAFDERLAILQAVQEVRTKVEDALPPVELEESFGSADAAELNETAWAIVAPEANKPPDLEERARALALARRAVELAPEESTYLDTLAWASFRAGLDAEALETSRLARDIAAEEKRDEFGTYLADLESAVDEAAGALARLASEREALALEIAERRTWRFEDPQDAWWHEQLEAVIDGVRSLCDPATGLVEGISVGVGPGVAHRRASLARWQSPEVQQAWAEAISAIEKSPAYGGLVITAQTWLEPLGPDPRSDLWEFADLRSGDVPERHDEGRLVTNAKTGVVFVLLPDATFLMGAQRDGPGLPNCDPQALPREGPVHEVTLSAFLVSKYELTQGQWRRLGGDSIEFWSPDPVHPVNDVSWTRSDAFCRRWDWLLPSEAQWEYAARGGTQTPWWTGSHVGELERLENVNSRRVEPVGARSANPFGLHGVCGNVREWCRDLESPYTSEPALDPVGEGDGSSWVMRRGGNCRNPAVEARSASRSNLSPEYANHWLGLRPARALEAP